jgi:hypothetical protein
MIVFERLGGWGFGNSLFQMAACIGIAKKKGTTWAVPEDCAFIKRYGDIFHTPLPTTKIGDWPRWGIGDPFNYLPYNEAAADVVIDGFFQNPQYFKDAQLEVRNSFRLKNEIEYDVNRDLWEMKKAYRPRLGIHVRRGDYVGNPDMNIVGDDYYSKALDCVEDLDQYRRLVFSDDITVAKDIFGPDGYEYIALPDIRTFVALKSCDVIITANSTFSWWAGYLADHVDTKVIMPKGERWFTEEYKKNHHVLYSGIHMPGAIYV